MQNGRNPTRRNRNIGTARQGHGQNNRHRVPGERRVRGRWAVFYERLTGGTEIWRAVGPRNIRFVVEPTRDDAAHALTLDDLVRILEFIPSAHLTTIQMIVLRQPKRKEEMLAPVWGRFVYEYVFRDYVGRAIVLDAFTKGTEIKWPRRHHPEDASEFERLRADGHPIEETKRAYVIRPTFDSWRTTQLYRTLPHEIGHWVQWLECVEWDDREPCRDVREQRFWSIPRAEREAFANRYADEFHHRLLGAGAIPFDRLISPERLARDGLKRTDFEI